jgi:ketosteroid isomerase-like protein
VALTLLAVSAHGAVLASPGTNELGEAEAHFASAVAANGIPHGFLEYLADSAVVLTPEPKPARGLYESARDGGARLLWQPELIALAKDKDFGWTSGPWLHFAKDATRADSGGHYFTVWRRSASGDWQVVLDGGIEHPVDAGAREALPGIALRNRPAARHAPKTRPDCAARFIDSWQHGGRARALKEHAANDVRLMQADASPLDGRAALGGDLLGGASLVRAHVNRELRSSAGDQVVAYGVYDLPTTQVALAHRYVFVAAFDAADDCRLALELVTPLADSAP